MATFWWVTVNGKDWNSKPLTWEKADELRERLKLYYPTANIMLWKLDV